MHDGVTFSTLMNSVCSGKSPCRCSWFGLKDIVTLSALKVTTENSELRAKPEDSTSFEHLLQCSMYGGSTGAKELAVQRTMLSLDGAHISKLRETYWYTTPVMETC